MVDGNIVYQGLANKSPEYFRSIGFKFEKFANPADIFMKILSVNYPKRDVDVQKLDLLVNNYNSEKRALVNLEMNKIKIPEFDLLSKIRLMAPNSVQFMELWNRNMCFVTRSPLLILTSLGISAFNGVLMMAIFYHQFFPFPPYNIPPLPGPNSRNDVH